MLPLYVENNNADTFVIKEKLSKTSNKTSSYKDGYSLPRIFITITWSIQHNL